MNNSEKTYEIENSTIMSLEEYEELLSWFSGEIISSTDTDDN